MSAPEPRDTTVEAYCALLYTMACVVPAPLLFDSDYVNTGAHYIKLAHSVRAWQMATAPGPADTTK